MKLPESQRPTMKSIQEGLNKKISSDLQRLFVLDIQNDCGCDVETYSSDNLVVVFHSPHGVSVKRFNNNIVLPMLESISDQDIWNVLAQTCNTAITSAGNQYGDFCYVNVIHNPSIDKHKVQHITDKFGGVFNCLSSVQIPETHVYFIPDPEFFGVLSANVGKFGVMCFAQNIFAHKVH